MIKSILDTDLYKFTTSYAYMKQYPDAEGKFMFVDRNKTNVTQEFIDEIKAEFTKLSKLTLTKEELEYCIKNITYVPRFYWEWLAGFKYDPEKINVWKNPDTGVLEIDVTDKLYKVSLYEIPVLATVAEVMNRNKVNDPAFLSKEDRLKRLDRKIEIATLNGFKFSEFGTRRRFSFDVQDEIIEHLSKHGRNVCVGTSNVYFAMKYGMVPMGTHPHEWFMFHGAQFGYKHANYLAMEAWQDTYDGDLGIALTDTYTSEVFFRNFSKKHAKLFDGIRQDSGNEYEFTDRAINRYKELGVNPISKTIVFSNGLNFEKAAEIADYCRGKINASFGIGTNLTNDTGVKAPNIVMKLINCRMNEKQPWANCIKLSDDCGKHLGLETEIANAKYELNIK